MEKLTEYVRVICKLEPGQRLIFQLPTAQPAKRDRYRRIAGLAHKVWGAGGYEVGVEPGCRMFVGRRANQEAIQGNP